MFFFLSSTVMCLFGPSSCVCESLKCLLHSFFPESVLKSTVPYWLIASLSTYPSSSKFGFSFFLKSFQMSPGFYLSTFIIFWSKENKSASFFFSTTAHHSQTYVNFSGNTKFNSLWDYLLVLQFCNYYIYKTCNHSEYVRVDNNL